MAVWTGLKRVVRSAKSRMAADQPRFRSNSETTAPYRKSQRMSQYPPSKYASERAFAAGGISARYASVAASALKLADGCAAAATYSAVGAGAVVVAGTVAAGAVAAGTRAPDSRHTRG